MGAFATANGVDLASLRLYLPRVGAWHAELVSDDGSILEGSVQLSIGGVKFKGTALRAGVQEGIATTRIVGGAGGLGATVAAKGYVDVPFSIPFQDLLNVAGESQSTACAAAALNQQLGHWTTVSGKAGPALAILVKLGAPGAAWRILSDGSIWVGQETWDPVTVDHEVLLDDPIQDAASLHMPKPTLLPGCTFLGRRVSYVEHSVEGDLIRTMAMFEK